MKTEKANCENSCAECVFFSMKCVYSGSKCDNFAYVYKDDSPAQTGIYRCLRRIYIGALTRFAMSMLCKLTSTKNFGWRSG